MLFGSGPAVILPAIQIFWLAGLAHALGVPVVSENTVDAFSLAAPNVPGGLLVVLGFGISFAVHYVLACGLVARVTPKT